MGDDGFLKKFYVELRRFNVVGDAIRVCARVCVQTGGERVEHGIPVGTARGVSAVQVQVVEIALAHPRAFLISALSAGTTSRTSPMTA